MVSELKVKYFSTGIKEELVCNLSLAPEGNSNRLCFEHDKLTFSIFLKDIVDMECFCNLLDKKDKKITAYCSMDKSDREYKGLRKIVWRQNNLALSQGGVRIEFEQEATEQLKKILSSIRSRA
jgi:hypothetical protein